jgi:hypothetical protein
MTEQLRATRSTSHAYAFAIATLLTACGTQPMSVGNDEGSPGPQLSESGDTHGASSDNPGVATGACSAGASRACGSSVGACKLGQQTCSNGAWGACTGGVGPKDEVCGDGIDNNCNSQVDENCGTKAQSDTHGTVLEGDAGARGQTLEADAGEDRHSVQATSGDASDEKVGTTSGDASDEKVDTTSGDAADEHVVTVTSDCSLAAPRLIAPLSTSRATLRAPTLTWALAGGTDGARVEVCTSRDCSTVEQTFDVVGTSGKIPSDLGPGVHYWRTTGRSGNTTGCTPSPVWEFFVNRRDATLGIDTSWGTMLDVNEDGLADVVATTSPSYSATANTYVYLGTGGGLSSSPSATLAAVSGGNNAYIVPVASAGDVNGDGFGDVVFGGGDYNSGYTATVYLGSPGGVDPTPIALPLSAAADTVASVGDVNRDGYADLGVATSGQVYVFLGGPNGPSTTPSVQFGGTHVGNAGDVNGDGYGDVIVTDQGSTIPVTSIYLGSPSGISTTPAVSFAPPAGVPLPALPIGVGDVNGDGYADVSISGNDNSTSYYAHRVFIHLGSATGTVPTPASELSINMDDTKTHFGMTKVGLDVNGDGYWDIAVGAPWIGQVFVFMGGPSGMAVTPSAQVTNGSTGGLFGNALSGGDHNGDAYEDLGVAAPSAGSGQAYFFYGGSGGVSTSAGTTFGPPSGYNFAQGLACAGGGA